MKLIFSVSGSEKTKTEGLSLKEGVFCCITACQNVKKQWRKREQENGPVQGAKYERWLCG